MKNARPIILVLVIVALAAAGWYYYSHINSAATGPLTASGTVETTEISIAPEVAGRIIEINVQEGDVVKAGDALFRLDDTLLQAQRDVAAASLETAKAGAVTAEAAVASAQTQYDNTLNLALTQNKPARTSTWYTNQPGEFTLPLWYYEQTEQLKAAQAEVDASQAALKTEQDKLATVETQAGGADFLKAETDLVNAQASYEVAKNLHDRATLGTNLDDLTRRQLFLLMRDQRLKDKGLDPRWVTLSAGVTKELRDAAQTIFDDAQQTLDDAQTAYEDAATTDGAKDVMKARAKVSIAQERYYTAMDYVRSLQTGAAAPTVTAAQNVLDQAKSAVAQAESAVKQAQANLDLLDKQTGKTVVTAPVDGVVLTRAGEPGSVVNAGGVVLTLGRLDELTITVYVAEDRMGAVALGQTAKVTVDSFPGQTFTGTVTFIADQAEFTPRNVQTVDGRKNTVFAVKLKLDSTAGQLKPGMPADVVFGTR